MNPQRLFNQRQALQNLGWWRRDPRSARGSVTSAQHLIYAQTRSRGLGKTIHEITRKYSKAELTWFRLSVDSWIVGQLFSSVSRKSSQRELKERARFVEFHARSARTNPCALA